MKRVPVAIMGGWFSGLMTAFQMAATPVTLTNAVDGAGLVFGGGIHESGTPVTLRAVPQIDWSFDHWEGVSADLARNNPVIVQASAGLQPKAVFSTTPGTGRFQGGRVLAWGDNSTLQAAVPADLGPVLKVAAGWAHSLALLADGTVRGWGDNLFQQRNPPAGLSNVVDIAASRFWSFAVTASGRVVSWGNGAPDFSGLTDAVTVASQNDLAVVLRRNGSVAAFGIGTEGIAQSITNAVGVGTAITASYAVLADGTVRGFGDLGQALGYLPLARGIVAVHGSAVSGRSRGCHDQLLQQRRHYGLSTIARCT